MNETIGNRIAKYRKNKGLTQEELASMLGVSSQAVSKWENDVSCPDISLLPQLSKVLGVTTDALLTGKNEEVKLLPEMERKNLDELTMRVYVNSAQGDKIRVNLPMLLGEHGDALKGIDLAKIVELVERGLIGKLVEVESADGHTVEVVVE